MAVFLLCYVHTSLYFAIEDVHCVISGATHHLFLPRLGPRATTDYVLASPQIRPCQVMTGVMSSGGGGPDIQEQECEDTVQPVQDVSEREFEEVLVTADPPATCFQLRRRLWRGVSVCVSWPTLTPVKETAFHSTALHRAAVVFSLSHIWSRQHVWPLPLHKKSFVLDWSQFLSPCQMPGEFSQIDARTTPRVC